MSSQLNTLDHEIMSLFLKGPKQISFDDLVRGSNATKYKVKMSVNKLMSLGFVLCWFGCGAETFYSFVLDCSYFPPLRVVDKAGGDGGAFSYDDPELAALVTECNKNL